MGKSSARGRQTWHISGSYNFKPEVEFDKISMTFFWAHGVL